MNANRFVEPAPAPVWLSALAALLVTGCSPALDWRTVPLPAAALQVTLPCKPDHAERTVEMAGLPVELTMVGCEADGATFAVSHAVLGDPGRLAMALTHWRAAVLSRAGAESASGVVDTAFVPAGALPVPQSLRSEFAGRGSDGAAMAGQGVWFARAAGPQLHIYHAVVYSALPRPDLADPFFAGLVLP